MEMGHTGLPCPHFCFPLSTPSVLRWLLWLRCLHAQSRWWSSRGSSSHCATHSEPEAWAALVRSALQYEYYCTVTTAPAHNPCWRTPSADGRRGAGCGSQDQAPACSACTPACGGGTSCGVHAASAWAAFLDRSTGHLKHLRLGVLVHGKRTRAHTQNTHRTHAKLAHFPRSAAVARVPPPAPAPPAPARTITAQGSIHSFPFRNPHTAPSSDGRAVAPGRRPQGRGRWCASHSRPRARHPVPSSTRPPPPPTHIYGCQQVAVELVLGGRGGWQGAAVVPARVRKGKGGVLHGLQWGLRGKVPHHRHHRRRRGHCGVAG